MSKICNVDDVIETLENMTHLMPDGSQERVEVVNPRLDDRNPDYVRVKVPRKMMTFNVIEQADEFDLKVDDIWQHDVDKEDDKLCFKLVPEDN